MARKTGKFLNKKSIVASSDDTIGQLSVPGAEVIEVQEESWASIIWGFVKGIILFAMLLAVLLMGLFTGLGMSIMNYVPVDGTNERSIVLRGAWADEGGKPPIGTVVAVSSTNTTPSSNWWEWFSITWFGIPNVSTVEIMSTDYDKLYITGTVDDAEVSIVTNPTVSGTFVGNQNVPLAEEYNEGEQFEKNVQLKNSFLVKCKAGACEPDTLFVISQEQIFGEIK